MCQVRRHANNGNGQMKFEATTSESEGRTRKLSELVLRFSGFPLAVPHNFHPFPTESATRLLMPPTE